MSSGPNINYQHGGLVTADPMMYISTGTSIEFDKEPSYNPDYIMEKDGRVYAVSTSGIRMDITKFVDRAILSNIRELLESVIARDNEPEYDLEELVELKIRFKVLKEEFALAEDHLRLAESITMERTCLGVAPDLREKTVDGEC